MKSSKKALKVPSGMKKVLSAIEGIPDLYFLATEDRKIIAYSGGNTGVSEKEIKKLFLGKSLSGAPAAVSTASGELRVRCSSFKEKDEKFILGVGTLVPGHHLNSLLWASWFPKDKAAYSGLVERITGYCSDEINAFRGKGFNLVVSEDAEKVKGLITDFVMDGKKDILELTYRINNRNGMKIWLQEMVLAKRNAAGEIISYECCVTEQSRLLEEKQELENALGHLRELNNAKDQFISVLSHDLKSPYTSILGFSDILLNESSLTAEERAEYLSYINLSSQNQLKLINNLLEWSRLITGRKSLQPVKIKILNAINEVIAVNTRAILKKNLVIRLNVDNYHYAEADPVMLTEVLNIIIGNSVKYSSPDNVIEIHANRFMDNRIEVIVKDEGVGINERNRGRIMKIDQIFSTPGTAGERGTGMSLIVAREMIKLHKGELWFYSEPGRGTEFHFTVPSSGNSILLIDTSESEKVKISNLLKGSFPGFRLYAESNSYDALKRISGEMPALIIAAHKLPLMTGLEFVKIVKKDDKLAPIPVIIYSEEMTDDLKKEYKTYGITDLLKYPVNLKVLKDRIEEILK